MIAAGEVIERPSAVLKELLENALDAQARHVEVELASGGRRLVQVADDGCGMNADDAVLCFERHATSKISGPSDLDSILSYGFRGEALPSIAAVSRVSLRTCPDDSGVGTEVTIHGGQLRSVKEVAHARGTTVGVRDVFYNTPARRKFLRTESTELRHSVREMTGLGLGAPGLGFRLSHGGRVLLECQPVESWQDRVQSLFGREMLQRGIPVEATGSQAGGLRMRLYGLLGRPGDAGGGYSEQYLLVNSRPVQARILRKAVLDGYEATIESGKQPFFIVYLDLDPKAVDVNVHPQKREVRFRDERATYQFVRDALAGAFARAGAGETRIVPAALLSSSSLPPPGDRPDSAARGGVAHFWSSVPKPFAAATRDVGPARTSHVAEGAPPYPVENDVAAQEAYSHAREPVRPAEAQVAGADQAPKSERRSADAQLALNLVSRDGQLAEIPASGEAGAAGESHLWQFQEKYIFASTGQGLWIIDQHVAHERILYEEAMAGFAGEPPASQRLLFPVTVELSPEQDAVLEEVLPILESMGFSLARLSGRSVIVDGCPGSVQNPDPGQLLREMIDDIAEVGFKRTGIKEQLAASFACHAAIKSGERLTPVKMRWLIERLFATSMPYVCPHGRPIVVKIDSHEFDERFGRT